MKGKVRKRLDNFAEKARSTSLGVKDGVYRFAEWASNTSLRYRAIFIFLVTSLLYTSTIYFSQSWAFDYPYILVFPILMLPLILSINYWLFYTLKTSRLEDKLSSSHILPNNFEGLFLFVLLQIFTAVVFPLLVNGPATVDQAHNPSFSSSHELKEFNFSAKFECNSDSDRILRSRRAFRCEYHPERIPEELNATFDVYWQSDFTEDIEIISISNLSSESEFDVNSLDRQGVYELEGYFKFNNSTQNLFSRDIRVSTIDSVSKANYRTLTMLFGLFTLLAGWMATLSFIVKLNEGKNVRRSESISYKSASLMAFSLFWSAIMFLIWFFSLVFR